MVDTKKSTQPQKAVDDSPADGEKSFKDHFGEPQGMQKRVVSDSTRIVHRDGVAVLTDSPREGDIPQSAVPGHSAQSLSRDSG
jgi:hypothetical protein